MGLISRISTLAKAGKEICGKVPEITNHEIDFKKLVDKFTEITGTPYLSNITDYGIKKVINPRNLVNKIDRKLHILYFTSSLALGGAEKIVQVSAKELSKKHDVSIMLLIASENIRFNDVGSAKIINTGAENRMKYIMENKFDFAITSGGAGFDYIDYLSQVGCPSIYIPYGAVSWNFMNVLPNIELFKKHSAIASYGKVAAINAEIFREIDHFKYYGIYGCVEIEKFKFRVHKPKPPYKLAFYGRISKEKNLSALYRLAYRLVTEYKFPIELNMHCGIDESAPRAWQNWATKSITEARNREYVYLKENGILKERGITGKVHDEMVKEDLVILTSDFEGEPLVYLEAMAAGTLCAGRDDGEIKRLLGDCGIVCDSVNFAMSENEIDQMCRLIMDHLQDSKLYSRKVKLARKKIEAEYDPSVWVDMIERIYGDL